ncbi:HEPN domain-containing protein, partial [bacterium]|nr:HEPN domain-containing protein [bacterium]
HDIRELLRILRNYGANVDLFLDLMELNIFAIQFRYEVFTEFETPLEREAIIEEVRPVLEHVDSLIGSELQD